MYIACTFNKCYEMSQAKIIFDAIDKVTSILREEMQALRTSNDFSNIDNKYKELLYIHVLLEDWVQHELRDVLTSLAESVRGYYIKGKTPSQLLVRVLSAACIQKHDTQFIFVPYRISRQVYLEIRLYTDKNKSITAELDFDENLNPYFTVFIPRSTWESE